MANDNIIPGTYPLEAEQGKLDFLFYFSFVYLVNYESFIIRGGTSLGIGLLLLKKSMSDEQKQQFETAYKEVKNWLLDSIIEKLESRESDKRIKNLKKKLDISSKWEKEWIIKWEALELRDETDEDSDDSFSISQSNNSYCENFSVIAGCDEEFLLFDQGFFASTEYKNSFKKGEIYRFCFFGELKKDSDNVIRSVEEGDFEISKISEIVPFIRNTYEEKEKSVERKNIVEKELEEKTNAIQEINKKMFDAKKELAELEIKFDSLQFEKTEIENKWTNPEKHEELLNIQKELEEKLGTTKEENRKLSSQLEKISKQDWNTTFEEKIQNKKIELEKLKDKVKSKLDNNALKSSLEVLLTANEQLIILLMEKVDEWVYSPTKKQLERSEEQLRKKINSAELQNICQVHSEIIRMEIQQKQWKEWKAQEQQIETYIEVPAIID